MSEWLAGGRAADVVLGLMALEAAGLWWLHATTGRGLPVREWLVGLVAGAMLVLALRAALLGGGVAAATPFLLAALVAHLADLGVRWRR